MTCCATVTSPPPWNSPPIVARRWRLSTGPVPYSRVPGRPRRTTRHRAVHARLDADRARSVGGHGRRASGARAGGQSPICRRVQFPRDRADLAGSGAGSRRLQAGEPARQARGGKWRICGVLDWEFACAATPLLDFAIFLRDERARPAGFGAAFANAYRSAGGVLPTGWRRLTRIADLLNLLQLL